MGYILATEAMRVVDRNERGNVTYRKRYKKGDEVDTSVMDEARVKALVESGALVKSDDDLGDAANPAAPAVAPAEVAKTSEGGNITNEVEDIYTDEEHDDLVAEAERRGLSTEGSDEDIRSRLRADDAES